MIWIHWKLFFCRTDWDRELGLVRINHGPSQRHKQLPTKIDYFPEKCIYQDWRIFGVNFVHIINFETSQQNFTVLNCSRKAHIRRFSKTYFHYKSAIDTISSIFAKLSAFNFLWEHFWAILEPIFHENCNFFEPSSNTFFVLLNVKLFHLGVSKCRICQNSSRKCSEQPKHWNF